MVEVKCSVCPRQLLSLGSYVTAVKVWLWHLTAGFRTPFHPVLAVGPGPVHLTSANLGFLICKGQLAAPTPQLEEALGIIPSGLTATSGELLGLKHPRSPEGQAHTSDSLFPRGPAQRLVYR